MKRIENFEAQMTMAEAIVRGNVASGSTVRQAIKNAVEILSEGIETHPDLPIKLRLRTERVLHDPPMGKVPNFSKRVSLLA